MERLRKYIAELIGTFVLVLFGCGTAVAVGCDAASGSGYIITAFAFGLSIVAMAYCIGNISGCHVNPAVSLGMLISRRMGVLDFIFYVVFQCAGAALACVAIGAIFGWDCSFGANQVQEGWEGGTVGGALVVEMILTFVFVLVVLGVTSRSSSSALAGIVIGLSLTLVHILGIALTGTSVNPARSLMPALFAGGVALEQVWVFLVGPLVGGACAALVYLFLDWKNRAKKAVPETTEATEANAQ